MAWSYTTGVLTSTGATEGAPDSLLAGIAIVQAADAARGYRSNFVAWLNNVEVRCVSGSFIILDDDAMIELIGSSFINPNVSGGVIHGNRSTLIIRTSTTRVDNALNFRAGSTFICRRANPQDPSPRIVYRNTARHDYPTFQGGSVPAKVEIAGLDCYAVGTPSAFLKLFFGPATIVSVANVRVFGTTMTPQWRQTTYNDPYLETLTLESEIATPNNVVFNRPTYYRATQLSWTGAIRSAAVTVRNPTFLNNVWNGAINVVGPPTAESSLSIVYTYANTFRSGLTPIQGVTARFTRSRQSIVGSPGIAPNPVLSATSDAQGAFLPLDLTDAYRSGLETTAIERFNWRGKARRYDKRTAGEKLLDSRVFFQPNINLSAGYSEEVQMLPVPHLTLTALQAAALTGIALAANGETGGTATISSTNTVAELWQYYRSWISRLENFDSEDTWTFDGTTINTAGWDISGVENITGLFISNNFNSSIIAIGITSATIYATAIDRDANTNAGATFSDNLPFAFGAVLSGVTMSGTLFLRVSVGTVVLFSNITIVQGTNLLDLGVQGQLSGINSKLELTAENLITINTGVKKASKLIPHNADLI